MYTSKWQEQNSWTWWTIKLTKKNKKMEILGQGYHRDLWIGSFGLG